jgi:SAM-dependent methyltransferase
VTHLTSNDLERSCSSHFLDDILAHPARNANLLHGDLLDVGCGFGGIAAALRDDFGLRSATGIDIDPGVVKEAAGKRVDVRVWNIEKTPWPLADAAFDVISSFGVLDYLPAYDDAISELRRLLRPGGVVVLSLPNLASWHNRLALLAGYQPRDVEVSRRYVVGVHPHYRRTAPAPVGHVHVPTADAFRELMRLYGFADVSLRGLRARNPTSDRVIGRLGRSVDRAFSKRAQLARRFLYVGTLASEPAPSTMGWWGAASQESN